jgi:hypothetical protein
MPSGSLRRGEERSVVEPERDTGGLPGVCAA